MLPMKSLSRLRIPLRLATLTTLFAWSSIVSANIPATNATYTTGGLIVASPKVYLVLWQA
jgi:predicted exporter